MTVAAPGGLYELQSRPISGMMLALLPGDDGSPTIIPVRAESIGLTGSSNLRSLCVQYAVPLDAFSEAVLGQLQSLIGGGSADEEEGDRKRRRIRERQFQQILEANPELLELFFQADIIIPQPVIRGACGRLRPDFIIAPVSGSEFCSVIEIKLPRARTFMSYKDGSMRICAELARAQEQLYRYGKAFDGPAARLAFAERYGVEVGRLELILLIGSRADLEPIARLQDPLGRRPPIRVIHWNDFAHALARMFWKGWHRRG